MQNLNFIIAITYTDGTVEKIPAHCTIEQINWAVEAYRLLADVESVALSYK
jgi:hypothetical protein